MATRKAADEETRAAAVAEIAAYEDGDVPPELELSNGIILAIKPIPPGIIERAQSRLERPRPPKYEVKEGVWDENPEDPEYEKALEGYRQRRIDISTDVLMLIGTEVIYIPEKVFGPGDDGWIDQSGKWEYFGIEPKLDTKQDRYLSWLDLYAIPMQTDVIKLMILLNRMAGLGEEEVQATIANFRRRAGGGADRNLPGEAAVHGDNVHADVTEPGADDRGEGGG